jgi:hypothetical protein
VPSTFYLDLQGIFQVDANEARGRDGFTELGRVVEAVHQNSFTPRPRKPIVLTPDNAGWHGEAGLAVPDGARLVFQPACTPDVQPAKTRGRWSTSPLSTSISPPSRPSTKSSQSAALAEETATIKSQAHFRWWPKIANPR